MKSKMQILHKELSYSVTGCVFDAFREIGIGFDEYTYHQGLMLRFQKEGLPFRSKPHIKLYYRDNEIADLEPDFVVDEAIVLELKAIQTDFLPENYTQIISYLRAAGKRLGILVNFGLLKAKVERIPFDERPLRIAEDFDEVLPVAQEYREEFWHLRNSIMAIGTELRLGYHAQIYQAAMAVELRLAGMECRKHVEVPVNFENTLINNYEIDYWLINQRVLLAVLAGSGQVRAYDVVRMRSYLRKLNLDVGLIAFWSKDHLKILGVGPKH
jgi:GxxExxY protein